MPDTVCPICKSEAGGRDRVGRAIPFDCPKCGCYDLSETVLEEVENGTRTLPAPEHFIALLVQLRKKSGEECPVVQTYDLNELPDPQ